MRLSDFRLHPGERFRYVYDFGAYWQCDIRLEGSLLVDAKQYYPVCIGGKGAAPLEHCRSPWAYMEMMDDYRSPPLDAMLVAAHAVRAVLEADPQSSIRQAIGDMEMLREAVEQLRDYHEFEPNKINRRRINAQLRTHTPLVGGRP